MGWGGAAEVIEVKKTAAGSMAYYVHWCDFNRCASQCAATRPDRTAVRRERRPAAAAAGSHALGPARARSGRRARVAAA